MAIRIARLPGGVPQDLGNPQIPGSKTHAQRAMCLAAFLPGRWVLRGAPANDDVATLARALRLVGAGIQAHPGRMVVTPVDQGNLVARLDLGTNGTALRMLSVLLPMLGRTAQLDGAPELTSRPMDAALDFLCRYGAAVEAETWPWSVGGELLSWPAELHVNGQLTSQVASGVMLGAALRVAGRGDQAPQPRSVYVHQPVSKGYLDVTARVLKDFGFEVTRQHKSDGVLYQIHEWQRPEELWDQEVEIPPDPSSLCFPLALAQLHGISWQPPVRGDTDPHPDWDFGLYLEKLAAAKDGEALDMVAVQDHPDCFPALAVLAATRRGQTRFGGIRTLRAKESDRIHAMAAGLAAAGADTQEREDGITVKGPLAEHAGTWPIPATHDHRVVMALALLGTVLGDGILLQNEGAVAKSWPSYFDWLARVAVVETVPDGT